MIASSLGVGLLFHIGMVYFGGRPGCARDFISPEISWVGVEILLFAGIVPTHARKTIIASLVAASMNPIGMLIARAKGVWHFGSAWNVLLMHYPDYLLLGVAGVISHVVTQLGRQVAQAREMGQLSARRAARARRHGRGVPGDAPHAGAPGGDQADPPRGARRRSPASRRELAARRFRREAEAAADLRSPHTVELYDFGVTEDGTLYFVMELLEGMDLETLVSRHGPLPAARVIHILRQVCESLEEAHARGLVHRDIKPANIHVGGSAEHDFVKVLDFGLVKSVKRPKRGHAGHRRGTHAGTPAYMAPEMALGEPADGRADIYALGCVAVLPAHRAAGVRGGQRDAAYGEALEEKPVPRRSGPTSDPPFAG